jgi:predicted ATPase with chaperone activity
MARDPEHCTSTYTYIFPIFPTPKNTRPTRTMVIHACHCVPLVHLVIITWADGGRVHLAGEISLAHQGMMLLDELAEFSGII